MICGLLLALSVTTSTALSEPAAHGVNVTLIAQLVPAATLLPQVFAGGADIASYVGAPCQSAPHPQAEDTYHRAHTYKSMYAPPANESIQQLLG
jgi:hypothetical protein